MNESYDEEMRYFHTRIREHEIARNELEEKIKRTHESFLDQQTRAMKYNLIFENITQVIPDTTTNENTEAVLKEFLKNEMTIDTQITFHNVHRLTPRRDRRPPSINAKFVYHSDKEMVINAARTTLVRKPYKVYQQYPQKFSDRRRELVPIMKQFRDQNQRAHIIRDKFFVNGRPYAPQYHRLPPRPLGISHGDYANGAHGQDQRQNHFS